MSHEIVLPAASLSPTQGSVISASRGNPMMFRGVLPFIRPKSDPHGQIACDEQQDVLLTYLCSVMMFL